MVKKLSLRPWACAPPTPSCWMFRQWGWSPVEENGWGTTDEQTETLRGQRPMRQAISYVAMVTTIIVIIRKQLHPLVGACLFFIFPSTPSDPALLTQLPRLQRQVSIICKISMKFLEGLLNSFLV